MSRSIGVFGTRTPARPPVEKSRQLAIQINRFDTPQAGFHFAEGVDITNNQTVRVRLMTVDESVRHLLTQYGYREKSQADLEQYVRLRLTGNGTSMPRPRIADFASGGGNMSVAQGGVMLFEAAQKVGSKDGVDEYRAYWPTILAKDASVEVSQKPMHFSMHAEMEPVAGEAGKRSFKIRAFADILHTDKATVLDADNAKPVLLDAFSNKHPGGTQARPFVMVRLLDLNPQDGVPKGQVYLARQISGAYELAQQINQDTGEVHEYKKPANAANSLNEIMNGRAFDGLRPEAADELRLRDDLLKLAYTAVTRPNVSASQLKFSSSLMKSDEAIEQAQAVLDDIRTGRAAVEIVPGERVDAGPILRKELAASVAKRHDSWQSAVANAKEQNQEAPRLKALYAEFRGKFGEDTVPLYSDNYFLQIQAARAEEGPRFIGRPPVKALTFPSYRPLEMVRTEASAPWIDAQIAKENTARINARTNTASVNAPALDSTGAPSGSKASPNPVPKPEAHLVAQPAPQSVPKDNSLAPAQVPQGFEATTSASATTSSSVPAPREKVTPNSPPQPTNPPQSMIATMDTTDSTQSPVAVNSSPVTSESVTEQSQDPSLEDLGLNDELQFAADDFGVIEFNEADFNAMLNQPAKKLESLALPSP